MTKLKPNPLAMQSGDDLPFSKAKQVGRTFYNVAEYKKMDAPEVELQQDCEDYLKQNGIHYIHLPAAAYKTAKIKAGIPDLIIHRPVNVAYDLNAKIDVNFALFVELKKKGGKARQSQFAFARHANVYLIYNFPDFKTLVDRFIKI